MMEHEEQLPLTLSSSWFGRIPCEDEDGLHQQHGEGGSTPPPSSSFFRHAEGCREDGGVMGSVLLLHLARAAREIGGDVPDIVRMAEVRRGLPDPPLPSVSGGSSTRRYYPIRRRRRKRGAVEDQEHEQSEEESLPYALRPVGWESKSGPSAVSGGPRTAAACPRLTREGWERTAWGALRLGCTLDEVELVGEALFALQGGSSEPFGGKLPCTGSASVIMDYFWETGRKIRLLNSIACAAESSGLGGGGQVMTAFGRGLQDQLSLLQAEAMGIEQTSPLSLLGLKKAAEGLCAVISELYSTVNSCGGLQQRAHRRGSQEEEDAGDSQDRQQVDHLDLAAEQDFALERGAIMVHLYEAVHRVDIVAGISHSTDTYVTRRRRLALLSLLRTTCRPYFQMLSRWLWAGDLQREHDPWEEFLLVSCAFSGREKGSDFMTEGFEHQPNALWPPFLTPRTVARIVSSGKALRMLSLASREHQHILVESSLPPLQIAFDEPSLQEVVQYFAEVRSRQMAKRAELSERNRIRNDARMLRERARAAAEELRIATMRYNQVKGGEQDAAFKAFSEAQRLAAMLLIDIYRKMGKESSARDVIAWWRDERRGRLRQKWAPLKMKQLLDRETAQLTREIQERGGGAESSAEEYRCKEEGDGTASKMLGEGEECHTFCPEKEKEEEDSSGGVDSEFAPKNYSPPSQKKKSFGSGVRITHTPGGASVGVEASLDWGFEESSHGHLESPLCKGDESEDQQQHQEGAPGKISPSAVRLEHDLQPFPEEKSMALMKDETGWSHHLDRVLQEAVAAGAKGFQGLRYKTDSGIILPFEVYVCKSIEAPVLEQCNAIDSAAVRYVLHDAQLISLLKALRSFYLGYSTSFLHEFAQGVYRSLCSWPAQGVVDCRRERGLAQVFAAAAVTSHLDEEPFFEDFSYSVSGDGGLVSGDPHSRLGMTFVQPCFHVRWPLCVLLPHRVMDTYRSIHDALFGQQLAICRIQRVWGELRAWRSVTDAVAVRQLHVLNIFMHDLLQLCTCLQSHASHAVASAWSSFFSVLHCASDLSALHEAHESYLAAMYQNLFLNCEDLSCRSIHQHICDYYDVVCGVDRLARRSLTASHKWMPLSDNVFDAIRAQQRQFVQIKCSLRCALLNAVENAVEKDCFSSLIAMLGEEDGAGY